MVYVILLFAYIIMGVGLMMYYYEKTETVSQRFRVFLLWPMVVYIILNKFRHERHTFNDL